GLVMTNWIGMELNRTVGGWGARLLLQSSVTGGLNLAVSDARSWELVHRGPILALGWGVVMLCAAVPLAFSYRNFRTLIAPSVWRQMAGRAVTLVSGWEPTVN